MNEPSDRSSTPALPGRDGSPDQYQESDPEALWEFERQRARRQEARRRDPKPMVLPGHPTLDTPERRAALKAWEARWENPEEAVRLALGETEERPSGAPTEPSEEAQGEGEGQPPNRPAEEPSESENSSREARGGGRQRPPEEATTQPKPGQEGEGFFSEQTATGKGHREQAKNSQTGEERTAEPEEANQSGPKGNKQTATGGRSENQDKRGSRCLHIGGSRPSRSPLARRKRRFEGESDCVTQSVGSPSDASGRGRKARPYEGFVPSKVKVTKPLVDVAHAALTAAGLNVGSRSFRFTCHLLHTGSPRRDWWVPMYCRLIEDYFGASSAPEVWRPAVEAGLVQYKRYSVTKGLSREFRVRPSLAEAYHDAFPNVMKSKTMYDLYTGKRCRACPPSRMSDDHGNSYPRGVQETLKALDRGYFDKPAVEAHLKELERQMEEALAAWHVGDEGKHPPAFLEHEAQFEGKKGSPEYHEHMARYDGQWYTDLYAEYNRRCSRYLHDKSVYAAVWAREPTETDVDGIYVYDPFHEVQKHGRLTERAAPGTGVGLQSGSRGMKRAAWGRLEGMRNFDVVACHPSALWQELEDAGFDVSWIERYVTTPDAKTLYAERAGLPVGLWKKCLLAVLYTGSMPTPEHVRRGGDITDYLLEAHGEEGLDEGARQLYAVLGPLKEVVAVWYEHLRTDYFQEKKEHGGGGWFLRNAVGQRIYPLEIDSLYERSQTIATHLLHGLERAYICELIRLSEDFDYEVISDEHDGIVTIGEIPEEAQERARQRSGFRYARLVEKAF